MRRGGDLRLYESMFVVDNARAKENLQGVMDGLKEMLARAGGEVVNMGKWDERRLTFQIKRQRRGTYILCHWNGPPGAPPKLERACRLSESVLRILTIVDEDGVEIAKPREEYHARRDGFGRAGRSQDRGARDRGKDRGKDSRPRPSTRSGRPESVR
jgi:small subunit ribosomal protein S6